MGIWAFSVSAEKRATMTVSTTTGNVEIPVSTQTHISFSKDLESMIVWNAEGGDTQTIDVDDIIVISFTIDEAVNVSRHEIDGLVISNTGGIITISAQQHVDYLVSDLKGRVVTAGSCDGSARLDLSSLPQGTYLIKANDKTLKFIKH